MSNEICPSCGQPRTMQPPNEHAIEIPMDNCGLTINVGRDGVWLHFAASNRTYSSINAQILIGGRGSISDSALRQWCADRMQQAQKLKKE